MALPDWTADGESASNASVSREAAVRRMGIAAVAATGLPTA